MRAITNTGPGKLEMVERPTPRPGPNQVLVRVVACGICATDLQMIDGWERTGYPSIPGHEWTGAVQSVGPVVDQLWVGHRVVAENVLSDGGEVGFEYPGGYAEYLVTEARKLHVLSSRVPPSSATLIEPLAVCVRGLRRLRLGQRPRVLVWGDGPIGLLMTALLCRTGVSEIVVVGGRAGRLALARELGATVVLNYHHLGEELARSVLDACSAPFPYVIEASGAAAAMQASVDVASTGGRVLLLGDYGNARAAFLWNDVLHRELELVGSCASGGAWTEAVRLAEEDELPLAHLVTHVLPAERFADGMSLARSRRDDVVKVVLAWPGDAEET
jgi:2-desacetyl-2-hydroxyethyl bacteriochlorophyllide A dehydrogenase